MPLILSIEIAIAIALAVTVLHPLIMDYLPDGRYKWRKPIVCPPCLSFWLCVPVAILAGSLIPLFVTFIFAYHAQKV